MSGTPLKRAYNGTPIPAKRRKRVSTVSIYTPPVSRLKRNYHSEFTKFLKSIRNVTDFMDAQKLHHVLPLRKKLRVLRKKSGMLHLYLKTLSYWKKFYTEYVNRMNDVMDCFVLTDIREVSVVIEEHKLPEELKSFVTQQLMEWREMFEDVKWMKTYRELCQKMEEQEKQEKEEAERLELIQMISLEMEVSKLDINEFLPLIDDPQELTEKVVARVFEENMSKQVADQLKNMPFLSRRNNTKEWFRKHYESPMCSTSSSFSDEDSTIESSSSMSAEGASSSCDPSSSTFSEEEEEKEENVDSFFSNRGL